MTNQRARYQTSLEDSARWDELELRDDDIVISAPSKSGTTWTQMICALLIFQAPDLPAPLTTLSPWLDMRIRPIEDVLARLAVQQHRRFIKTHTPLDGVPFHPGVTYLAVGRDPRDVAVSLHHQSRNLDRIRLARLLGEPAPEPESAARPDERAAFLSWLANEDSPFENLDSLRGLAWQQSVAWSRRRRPNVVLLHYGDLSRDLVGQMRRLADCLGITVPERTWPTLVGAATFDQMRQRADDLVPDERQAIFKANARFFRSGRSGQWRAWLTADDIAEYLQRIGALTSPALAHWLHHGFLGQPAQPTPLA